MTQPTRMLTQFCKSMDYGEPSPVQLGNGFRRERRANCLRLRRKAHGSSNGSITSSSEPTRNHVKPRRRFLRKEGDRKSTRLNSSHVKISYAVFCLKKKKKENITNKLNEKIMK